MEEIVINLNEKTSSNDNNLLLEIVNKLETIISEINGNEDLVNKIKDIISSMNNYIEENKKKCEEISKYKENLDKEYKKRMNESVTINNKILILIMMFKKKYL